MRVLNYNRLHERKLEDVATRFGVDPEKLWRLYTQIMRSNFEQDLWDIANENIEELKGD